MSEPQDERGILRVLIVDDSRELQRSLSMLLSAVHDLRIVGYAEDVAGALDGVVRLRPDLVVLDVALRGVDRGIDVLRWIVRTHPDIQVVMLSNFTWQAMRQGLMAAGARAYFDKGDEFMRARDWIAARARVHRAGPRADAG
ncbi:MAG: Response regulator protein VraR [Pseudomonadota bacterium]|jgi:DNA-binding NarL/FixJ family response regulator